MSPGVGRCDHSCWCDSAEQDVLMLVMAQMEWFGLQPSLWSWSNGAEINPLRDDPPWRQGGQVSLSCAIKQNIKHAALWHAGGGTTLIIGLLSLKLDERRVEP